MLKWSPLRVLRGHSSGLNLVVTSSSVGASAPVVVAPPHAAISRPDKKASARILVVFIRPGRSLDESGGYATETVANNTGLISAEWVSAFPETVAGTRPS